jgi:protein SCO1/2
MMTKLRFAVFAGIVSGAALVNASALADDLNVRVIDRPAALPEFTLEDQAGRPFTLAQLRGHWTLIAIGYTSCPDICPFTLANLNKVVESLAKRGDGSRAPEVIFLAVDPARDKPGLASYVAAFNRHFIGVTGADKQIRALAAGLDDFFDFEKPDRHGDYEVAHSAEVGLVDPAARLRAKLMPPMPPEATAGYLAHFMAKPGTEATLGR